MKNVTESQSNDDTNNIPVITSKNIITIMFMIPSNKQVRKRLVRLQQERQMQSTVNDMNAS